MAIVAREVGFAYGRRRVLEGVDLSAADGRLTVILGPNGGGKSTLLRILAGLLDPTSGRVEVDGRDLVGLSPFERARRVGYLPQFHRPAFPFKVLDVVLTGRAPHVLAGPVRRDMLAAGEALDRMGLPHLAERPYTELSGGERQQVMMARVLAQGARTLLLDEPTAHLDFANQARLLKLVAGLCRQGCAVVAVLHDPNAAIVFGDELFLLKDGRAVHPGADKSTWRAEMFGDLYGLPLMEAQAGPHRLLAPIPERAS